MSLVCVWTKENGKCMDKRNYAMKERVMSKGEVKKEVQENRETLEKKRWGN